MLKRSTAVRSMNISILVAGSSRRNVATRSQASRRTRAHSLPCWEPVCRISPPRSSAVKRSRTIWAMPRSAFAHFDPRPDGHRRHVVLGAQLLGLLGGLLVGDDDLIVAFAALDPLLQQDQAVQDLFRARRAARDVDVDGDRLIGARHGRVVLI